MDARSCCREVVRDAEMINMRRMWGSDKNILIWLHNELYLELRILVG